MTYQKYILKKYTADISRRNNSTNHSTRKHLKIHVQYFASMIVFLFQIISTWRFIESVHLFGSIGRLQNMLHMATGWRRFHVPQEPAWTKTRKISNPNSFGRECRDILMWGGRKDIKKGAETGWYERVYGSLWILRFIWSVGSHFKCWCLMAQKIGSPGATTRAVLRFIPIILVSILW